MAIANIVMDEVRVHWKAYSISHGGNVLWKISQCGKVEMFEENS